MNNKVKEKKFGVSGSTLKIIAIITMAIDHFGAVIVYRGMGPMFGWSFGMSVFYYALRLIGRLGFPLFAFLLAEGFAHTHSREKYMLRMLIFALISEIPADFAFYGQLVYLDYQNIFWTLLLGLLALYLASKTNNWFLKCIPVAALMALAEFCNTDYGYIGVGVIVLLYHLRDKNHWVRFFAGSAAMMLSPLEYTSPIAFALMQLYNGERGLKIKYFFYIFYPAHLLLFGLIVCFCF